MPARISIAAKLFLTYFVITGVALAFAGTAGYLQFRKYALDEVDSNLLRQARLVAEMFRPHMEASRPDVKRIASEGDRAGKDLDIRLTILFPDGRVAADSLAGSGKIADMENHSDRPEIRTALSGKTGISMRRSITMREEERYLAIPILSGGRIVGIARTSVPVTLLSAKLSRVRAITWGTGIAAFLLMLAGTAVRAKKLTVPLSEMSIAAREISSGKLGARAVVRTGDELEEMAESLNRMASRLETTLSQAESGKTRLAAILENLSEGIIVVAGDRTVRMMNREGARILGVPHENAEGRPIPEVVRRPEILAFLDAWKEGEIPACREVKFASRAGERIVRILGTEVRHDADHPADLLLTLRDVTEERRLAKIKSDFASNASHELRTPLTNIRGYLEAMQDAQEEGAPPEPSFLSIAHANAVRMERLIEDLLELSRAESGESPLEKESAPIGEFLERVASLHREAAAAAGKTLDVKAEDVTLRADLRRLAVAVSNLVDNAIRHGREGGHILLEGRAEPGHRLLEVVDDGPGIAPEHLPRLFERFYRADKGRSREPGGTGLGLSIAKHIVESHGGTLGVESRLGIGSRFSVRIPE